MGRNARYRVNGVDGNTFDIALTTKLSGFENVFKMFPFSTKYGGVDIRATDAGGDGEHHVSKNKNQWITSDITASKRLAGHVSDTGIAGTNAWAAFGGTHPGEIGTGVIGWLCRRPLRGERYEFPTPHQPVLWVQDVAHAFEARRAEYPSRRAVLRPRVRTNHTRAGVQREFDECSGRFLGVPAPLVTRFHAVGDFDGPFRVWRALERAGPDDHTGHGVDHGETMGPRTHRRAAKPREPVR